LDFNSSRIKIDRVPIAIKRIAVSKESRRKNDDENDEDLFDKLQEYVLEHFPNPERTGCLDRETLRVFVEDPGKLDLADPKYLHIFRCAECTRDLMCLRRSRDERQGWSAEKSEVTLAKLERFVGKVRDMFRRP
jgi:hypothetical protein